MTYLKFIPCELCLIKQGGKGHRSHPEVALSGQRCDDLIIVRIIIEVDHDTTSVCIPMSLKILQMKKS